MLRFRHAGLLVFALPLLACGGGAASNDKAYEGDEGSSSCSGCDEGTVPSPSGDRVSDTAPSTETGQSTSAGVLTAGDWDDNLNFSYYLSYLAGISDAISWGLDPLPSDRVAILVTSNDGDPLRNAAVTVTDGDGLQLASLRTGSDGRAYFFPSADGTAQSYSVQVQLGTDTTTHTFAADTVSWSFSLPHAKTPAAAMDVALLLDTTGSMGDELSYLQTELAWVIEALETAHPDLALRLALVAYRDQGDAYEVKSFDFTTDVPSFLSQLASLSAAGGGDYPESMAEAANAALDLGWSETDAVRVAFLVADAPPQPGRQASTRTAALHARSRAIRIFPVAASGVGDSAEWVMRQMAEVTGGRYLFLTDDSGVGGSHALPHIPCYLVQQLNHLMLRVLEGELAGAWQYPSDDDVLRTVGSPVDGQCQIDGQTFCY